VKESIDRLGFIPDLILLHNPFLAHEKSIAEFYGYVETLVEDGTLKGCSLGLSNFRCVFSLMKTQNSAALTSPSCRPQDIEEIMAVARVKPVVNRGSRLCSCQNRFADDISEIEYHPYVLAHLDPVMALHEKYKIVVQSYGPLTPIIRHKTGGPLKPVLTKIAQRLSKETGKDVDEIAVLLLWTMGMNVVALSSSLRDERIKAIAATESLPDLTKEDMEEIESAGRKVHFRHYVSDRFGGAWNWKGLTGDLGGAYEQGLPGAGPPGGCLSGSYSKCTEFTVPVSVEKISMHRCCWIGIILIERSYPVCQIRSGDIWEAHKVNRPLCDLQSRRGLG
jgi:diketogulonate reductase-like aldo/keto reductase